MHAIARRLEARGEARRGTVLAWCRLGRSGQWVWRRRLCNAAACRSQRADLTVQWQGSGGNAATRVAPISRKALPCPGNSMCVGVFGRVFFTRLVRQSTPRPDCPKGCPSHARMRLSARRCELHTGVDEPARVKLICAGRMLQVGGRARSGSWQVCLPHLLVASGARAAKGCCMRAP
eukprot:365615-Chlamydomonas_euryale.AAC.4